VRTLAPLADALAALSADIDALHSALAATVRLCVQHVGTVPSGEGERDAAVADRDEDGDESNEEGTAASDEEDSDDALSGTAFSVADDGDGASAGQEKSRQEEVLQRVRDKLEGIDTVWCAGPGGAAPLSVREQVSTLISQATAVSNLAAMYEGWAAWI